MVCVGEWRGKEEHGKEEEEERKEERKKEERRKEKKERWPRACTCLPLVVFGEADRPVVLAQDDKAPEDDCSDIDVARPLIGFRVADWA